jgi:type I restriction enzyme, S subunit
VSGGSTNQPIARTLLLTEVRLKQWNGDVICASFCKRFGFKSAEDAAFFYFHVREYRDRGDILAYQKESASSLKNFNFEAFMNSYRMTVPPASLRRLFFESAIDFLQQQSLLSSQITRLAQARDLLLPKLMNGEIAV